MTATIRVAHVSDVHLGPIVGFTPRYWNAKRATGFINWRRNRRDAYRRDVLDRLMADLHAQAPDHIAVTGDLCNIGLPEEIEAGAAWLSRLGSPDQVSVIPGNHDIYSTIGRDIGIARWAAYMRGMPEFALESAAVEPRRARLNVFPYVRRIGHVAMIGLNSAVETPPMVAAGQLGADQRARLAVLLDETGAQGLTRVVMIHHPPLPGQTRRSHALNDAAALRDILVAHGAELVIHGHLHRMSQAVLARASGAIPVIGVPSASLAHPHRGETLARYHLIEIGARSMTIIGRGLETPDGDVVECARYVFVIDAAGTQPTPT